MHQRRAMLVKRKDLEPKCQESRRLKVSGGSDVFPANQHSPLESIKCNFSGGERRREQFYFLSIYY